MYQVTGWPLTSESGPRHTAAASRCMHALSHAHADWHKSGCAGHLAITCPHIHLELTDGSPANHRHAHTSTAHHQMFHGVLLLRAGRVLPKVQLPFRTPRPLQGPQSRDLAKSKHGAGPSSTRARPFVRALLAVPAAGAPTPSQQAAPYARLPRRPGRPHLSTIPVSPNTKAVNSNSVSWSTEEPAPTPDTIPHPSM